MRRVISVAVLFQQFEAETGDRKDTKEETVRHNHFHCLLWSVCLNLEDIKVEVIYENVWKSMGKKQKCKKVNILRQFQLKKSFPVILPHKPYLYIIVPTPLLGGGTIYSNELFLFRQFWPIDILIVEKCEWYH